MLSDRKRVISLKKAIKFLKSALMALLCLSVIGTAALLGINGYVVYSTADRLLSPQEAAVLTDVDCILVLGCGVNSDGTPSHMLEDRLKRSLELYDLSAAPKLLMSGDHGQVNYNEVGVMKQFAVDAGVPSADVFMDHAGFSTYESLYRARDIFGAKKILIISQEYHLYRALYIAEALGLEAWGVSADYRSYSGQAMREVREILARCKDVLTSYFQPEPTYLGSPISLTGSGDVTND